MTYVVLAALAVAIFGGWHWLMALAGRSSFPVHDRTRLREWGPGDVAHNARRGRSELADFGHRHRP